MKINFAAALLLPLSAVAQQATPLDPLVVTATRTPQNESQALAALIVISRDEIERAQAGDVAELLRFYAGIDIARNGGPGQVTSVFIRGGESNHTLVLVDGVRINPGSAGGAALQNLAPEMIERIEIVKGPRATLYGSNAIAGVINIITRHGGADRASLALRAGSADTRDASAGFSHGSERVRFSLDVDDQRASGLPTCASATTRSGFAAATVNARGSATLGDTAVAAHLWNTQGNTEYLDFCSAAFGNHPVDQDFRNQVAEVSVTRHLATRWESSLSASRAVDDIRQQQPNFLGDLDRVRTVRPRLDWHNVIDVGPVNRVSAGVDLAREQVEALSFGTAIAERRNIESVYAQDEIAYGRQHGLLAAAYTHDGAFGGAVTWNAEYGFDVLATTRLVAAAGSGFRAPDADDRFGFGGNPDLRPERARNYEVGVKQTLGSAQSLDLRAFESDVHDLITLQFDPANPPGPPSFGFRAVNLDRYRDRGVELTWRAEVRDWSATVTGIAQNPTDVNAHQPLLRRARRSAAMKIVRRFDRASLGLDILASGPRPDIDSESGQPVTDGGYALLNLTSALRLDDDWQLQARVENLLDKNYQTAAGFNQPGASFYVGLRYGI